MTRYRITWTPVEDAPRDECIHGTHGETHIDCWTHPVSCCNATIEKWDADEDEWVGLDNLGGTDTETLEDEDWEDPAPFEAAESRLAARFGVTEWEQEWK